MGLGCWREPLKVWRIKLIKSGFLLSHNRSQRVFPCICLKTKYWLPVTSFFPFVCVCVYVAMLCYITKEGATTDSRVQAGRLEAAMLWLLSRRSEKSRVCLWKMTGIRPGRRNRGTWPGAFVLAVLEWRPGFAEMWQAAGSARMWENRIPGSSQTLPNLKMPLQEATPPPPPSLSLPPLFPCCQPLGLLLSSVKCEGWLQRLMCVSQKFPHTKKVKRVSSSLGERNLILTLCSLTLLSLSLYFLPPSDCTMLNLLSVFLPIRCSCPFLSLFEPAHFHSSHGIMVSGDCGTRQRCNQ